MKDILCPLCKSVLVVTHQDRYESLSEHVCNPNGTPSMKDGYQCSDKECFSHFLGATWTYDGSLYQDPPSGMGWTLAHRLLEERSEDGIPEPLNSWQRSYTIKEKRRKKYTLSINLYWVILRIEPRYHQIFSERNSEDPWKPGDDYKWKYAGTSWTWFRKDKGMGYISFSPIWQILKFKTRDFNDNYHKALQHDEKALKSILKIYTDKAYWSDTQTEPRFWYRVANKILRLWYRGHFQILNNLQ